MFRSWINCFISNFTSLIWLLENNFISLNYGLKRTGGLGSITDHFYFPIVFALKQIAILIPFFIMLYLLITKSILRKLRLTIN